MSSEPLQNQDGGTDGESAPSRPQNKRLQQTQAQVDEVVDIMRGNVENVLKRDADLSNLVNRTDDLQHGASLFQASAGKLKNKYWWKNMKMNIIIGSVVLLVLILLGWYIFGGKKSEAPASVPAPVSSADHGGAAARVNTAPKKVERRRRRINPKMLLSRDNYPLH